MLLFTVLVGLSLGLGPAGTPMAGGQVAEAQQDTDYMADLVPPQGCPGGPEGVSWYGTVCPDGSLADHPPPSCVGGELSLYDDGWDEARDERREQGIECPEGLPPPGCIGGPPAALVHSDAIDTDFAATCPDGTAPEPVWVCPDGYATTSGGTRCTGGSRPETVDPPQGCPGGPAGEAAPGTQCPDGSIPVPPTAPPGCPGGLSRVPPQEDTTCRDGASPEPVAPPGCVGGPPIDAADGEPRTCPDATAPRDVGADRAINDALLSNDTDRFSRWAYDIGCDEGGMTDFMRKLWCGFQALPYAAGKWATGMALGVMRWALDYQVAEALTPIADALSRVYDSSLIGPLGVRSLAWTVAAFVAAWHVLRSRTARGLSELATTFVIALVGAIVLADPAGYLEGAVELTQRSSGALVEAVDGAITEEAGDPDDRLGDVLDQAFVAEPYDVINWGAQLEGDCAAARDEILEDGPWGSSDEPRETMRDAGCDTEADFNARPTDERALASVIVAIAAITTAALLILVSVGVFLAQLTLVFIFAAASIVWVAALFPGARGALWWWISKLVWSAMAAIAATFILSWLAITVTVVLESTDDLSVLQRCLVVLLVTVFAWRIRSQLGRISEALRRRLGDQLSRIAPSELTRSRAQLRWPALAAAQSAGSLRSTARELAQDVPGGQMAMTYGQVRLLAGTGAYGRRRGGVGRSGQGRRGVVRGTGARAWGIAKGTPGEVGTLGRALGRVAMAPVLGPQAYVAAYTRATDRSLQLRARLAQARGTRQQWAYNVRHPINIMRGAHQQARTQAGTGGAGRFGNLRGRFQWPWRRTQPAPAPQPPRAQPALPKPVIPMGPTDDPGRSWPPPRRALGAGPQPRGELARGAIPQPPGPFASPPASPASPTEPGGEPASQPASTPTPAAAGEPGATPQAAVSPALPQRDTGGRPVGGGGTQSRGRWARRRERRPRPTRPRRIWPGRDASRRSGSGWPGQVAPRRPGSQLPPRQRPNPLRPRRKRGDQE